MEDNTYYNVGLEKTNSHFDGPKLTRGFSFTIIEDREIETRQKRMIDEVIEIMGVTEVVARAFLLKFQWDKVKLFQTAADDDHLVTSLFNFSSDQNMQNSVPQICPVCYEDSDKVIGMECGHTFCEGCY